MCRVFTPVRPPTSSIEDMVVSNKCLKVGLEAVLPPEIYWRQVAKLGVGFQPRLFRTKMHSPLS